MRYIKYSLFIFFIVVLLLPFIQQKTNLINIKPLDGSFVKAEPTIWSKASWFSGKAQDGYSAWLDDHIGFKNVMVRIYNQVDYSLFSKIHANDILLGREDVLFEQRYIDAHFGNDLVNPVFLDEKLMKTQVIKDSLKKRGIELLVVIAPSKADFYPEYIEGANENKSYESNYNYLNDKFSGYGISSIDFNQYFIDNKAKKPYPLFTKSGIHWSDYAAMLVADSLIHYMEQTLAIDMPDLNVVEMLESEKPSSTDYDLGNLLNIYSTIDQGVLAYPKVEFNNAPSKTKPKVLVIGDSFYWNLEHTGMFDEATNNHEFWYYFNTAHGDNEALLSSMNIKEEVEGQDMIILLATAAGIQDFDLGFANRFFTLYTEGVSPVEYMDDTFFQEVEAMKNNIKGDEIWLREITTKAKGNNISVEQMIQLDAEYMVKESMK